jgi:hypothetical protein
MNSIWSWNFSEFMRFLPKGLNPIKIQTSFKLDLFLEFIIQKVICSIWNYITPCQVCKFLDVRRVSFCNFKFEVIWKIFGELENLRTIGKQWTGPAHGYSIGFQSLSGCGPPGRTASAQSDHAHRLDVTARPKWHRLLALCCRPTCFALIPSPQRRDIFSPLPHLASPSPPTERLCLAAQPHAGCRHWRAAESSAPSAALPRPRVELCVQLHHREESPQSEPAASAPSIVSTSSLPDDPLTRVLLRPKCTTMDSYPWWSPTSPLPSNGVPTLRCRSSRHSPTASRRGNQPAPRLPSAMDPLFTLFLWAAIPRGWSSGGWAWLSCGPGEKWALFFSIDFI